MISLEQIQIFYELAMSVGKSLDINTMLNEAIFSYLRKLNCTGALVYRFNSSSENSQAVELVYKMPYALNVPNSLPEVHAIIEQDYSSKDVEALLSSLPISEKSETNRFFHIMELENFGFLVLIRSRGFLAQEVLLTISEINNKLAQACNSCITNQKLEESKRRFHALADSTFESIFFFKGERCINQNTVAEQMFGYSLAEINGKHFTAFFENTVANLNVVEEGIRSSLPVEAIAKRKNGDVFHCEIQQQQRVIDKEPVTVMALRDISVQKEEQSARIVSEEKYKIITESTLDIIFSVDANKIIQFVSESVYKILGYTTQEMIGRSVLEFLEKENIDKAEATLLSFFENKKLKGYLTKVYHKNGQPIDIEINGRITGDGENKIGVGTMRNISQLIKDKLALEETQVQLKHYAERMELALLGSDAGLWDWNIQTDHVYFNERWCTMLGYQPSELKPHVSTWSDLVHPDDMPMVLECLNLHMKGETKVYTTEHRVKTKQGEWLWILDTGRVTERDPNGNPLRAVGTHIDITEKKQDGILKNLEQEISIQLSQTKNLDKTLQLSLDAIIAYSKLDIGCIHLLDENGKNLRLLSYQGMSAELFTNTFLVRNRLPNIDKALEGIPVYDEVDEADKLIKTTASLPIKYGSNVIGLLHLGAKSSVSLSAFSKKLLERISKLIGPYIARAKQEDVLQQNRENLDTLFNTIDDFIFILDMKGKILHTNLVVQRRLGYTNEELESRSVLMLHSPHKNSRLEQLIQNISSSGEDSFTIPLCSKTHEEIPVETKVIVGKWNNKEAIIGISRDITERQTSDNKLKEQSLALESGLLQQTILSEIAIELNTLKDFKKQIQSILNRIGIHIGVSRVYIFEDNTDGSTTSNTFEWCNLGIEAQMDELQGIPYEYIPSWKKILDEKGKIFSENIAELPQDLRDILEPQEIKSIIAYPIIVQQCFFGFIGFDECTRIKKWTMSELELLRTISGMIANAYERRLMELSIIDERDKATSANKAKSEFLANMSHEIRTPMNAILGFSEALYNKSESKTNKRMLKSVVNSGKLLLSLLNDILDLSKIEAGKLVLSPQPVDLVNVIHELVLIFEEKAKQKNILLEESTDHNLPQYVVLDEIRIKQVLFNLVGNAMKFTHKGKVHIETNFVHVNDNAGNLTISITDTGIGIAQNDQKKIFEAFRQASGQDNRKYGGAGLGLSISKRLTQKMGGKISLQSEIGQGSSFCLHLPNTAISLRQPRITDQTLSFSDIDFLPATLLVVDDVEYNIEAVTGLLSGKSFSILTADGGQQALEILNSTLPDLILLDIRMPGEDGFDVSKLIKENARTNKIPIIAYTASVFSAERIKETSTFDDVLFKPTNLSSLLFVLSKYLKHTKKAATETNEESEQIESIELVLSDNLGEIQVKVKEELIPVWEEVNGTLILYKMEEFANRTLAIGTEMEVGILVDYASVLLADIEAIDLEELQKNIANFQNILVALQITT